MNSFTAKTQEELMGLPILPHLSSGEELKVKLIINGQQFNQSHLSNEASIKTKKDGGSEFQMAEHMRIPGGWCTWRKHGSSVLLSISLPYVCLHLIMSFTINW
jgi:hypothetical protein